MGVARAMALLERLQFGALAVYSPRDEQPRSRLSKTMCHAVKENGSVVIQGKSMRAIPRMISKLREKIGGTTLADLFADEPVLVPAPRSTPFVKGELFPPRIICDQLVAAGFGHEVHQLLQRTKAVQKASHAAPADRPTAMDHYRTLKVISGAEPPDSILIVDDVITSGCMLLSAASRLKQAFPQARIRAFALVRTMSDGPIENIYLLCRGTITLRDDGLRTLRRP